MDETLKRSNLEQRGNPETLKPTNPEAQLFNGGNLVLITGTTHPELARNVAGHMGLTLDEPVTTFDDSETSVQIAENLRGKEVVILQSTCRPVNESWMQLYLMADAARRGSAKHISAVVPYFGYARQDRKSQPREPISSALMARFCETAGIDHLLTLDLHADQTQGTFHGPWDNLPGSYAYIPEILKHGTKNKIVVSPDAGRLKADEKIAKKLNMPLASIYKSRSLKEKNVVDSIGLMGDVKGMDCWLIDDLTLTGGTLMKGSDLLMENGAASVGAVVTHFTGDKKALDRLYASSFTHVIMTDTTPVEVPDEYKDKIRVVSVAPMLAEAIWRNQTGESLSEVFYK